MAEKTMNLYLIQSPEVFSYWSPRDSDEDDPRDALKNMLKAYRGSIPVRDVGNFVGRVFTEYFRQHLPIKKMVIGTHGTGLNNGYGLFYIGKDMIMDDDDGHEKLERLRPLAPLFAPHADVFIMACKTG